MKTLEAARFTIFDTPLVKPLLRLVSLLYLKLCGWRLEGDVPADNRFIMIAAPHTSNWDLPMMLAFVFVYRLKVYWFGKKSLFIFPCGIFLRWLGGIAVDRSQANNYVEQAVRLFDGERPLALVIPPVGTRQKVKYWKTGFYHIAHGAQVPIVLGFIDFRRKIGGSGGLFAPTGNVEADMTQIRSFYAGITGKNPLLTSSVVDGPS